MAAVVRAPRHAVDPLILLTPVHVLSRRNPNGPCSGLMQAKPSRLSNKVYTINNVATRQTFVWPLTPHSTDIKPDQRQRKALVGTPRGPGAALPAPSAPSGPHIPPAGLGNALDRGGGAGGVAQSGLGRNQGALPSRPHVPAKGPQYQQRSTAQSDRPAGTSTSLTSIPLGGLGTYRHANLQFELPYSITVGQFASLTERTGRRAQLWGLRQPPDVHW